MTQEAGAVRPDVTDMIAVHGVFRDTLAAAPVLVGGVAAGDADRIALLANYYDNVLLFLEDHHETEEELVFPLLRQRCSGEDAFLDRLAEEHVEALELLAAARSSLEAWPGGGSAAGSAVVDSLKALHTQLVPHLDAEDAEALPLCAANLSVEEWGALPGHGMANFGGDKIWLILGLILQRMNEPQRAGVLEHLPPPALEMWTGFGEQAFTELSQQVVVEVRTRVPA
jgi:hypothetical protein